MSVLQRLQPYPGLRVLISGGAAGIGEVLAAAYLEAGAKVHVCDVSEPALAAFRDKYPGTVATRADVSDAAQIEAVFQVQREQFGRGNLPVGRGALDGAPRAARHPLARQRRAVGVRHRPLAVRLAAAFVPRCAAQPVLAKQQAGVKSEVPQRLI